MAGGGGVGQGLSCGDDKQGHEEAWVPFPEGMFLSYVTPSLVHHVRTPCHRRRFVYPVLSCFLVTIKQKTKFVSCLRAERMKRKNRGIHIAFLLLQRNAQLMNQKMRICKSSFCPLAICLVIDREYDSLVVLLHQRNPEFKTHEHSTGLSNTVLRRCLTETQETGTLLWEERIGAFYFAALRYLRTHQQTFAS